jgi:hypothetical protein
MMNGVSQWYDHESENLDQIAQALADLALKGTVRNPQEADANI